MTDYHFFADLFDTYQSFPDWLKLAWLIVPGLVVLLGLVIWRRPRWGRQQSLSQHQHICSVFIAKDGTIRLYSADDIHTPITTMKITHQPDEAPQAPGNMPDRSH